MKWRENELLSKYTTFRIGGPARYFVEVESVKDMKEAVAFAKEKRLPIFVLGGGSNVLVHDEGFPGVVIASRIGGMDFQNVSEEQVEVVAGSGVVFDDLVLESVNRKLHGLVNLSIVPGTVGAAPVQNIYCYGTAVSDTIKWVEVLEPDGTIKKISNNDCAFGYRESIFKHGEARSYIILRVAFLLSHKGEPVIKYEKKDISKYLQAQEIEHPTLSDMRNAIIVIRESKLPNPDEVGTAGSFFKNPIISMNKLSRIQKDYPDIKYYTLENNMVKVPAGWLVEHVSKMKGVLHGDVGASPKHALTLVNVGNASAHDVVSFANTIIDSVQEKTGITLEPEVCFIPEEKFLKE